MRNITANPTCEDLQLDLKSALRRQKELEKEILVLKAKGYTETWNEGYQAGKDTGYVLALFDMKNHEGKHELHECKICAAPYFLPDAPETNS